MQTLLADIKSCRHCSKFLDHEPRPVVHTSSAAKILLIGQAPGTRVHKTGIPWNDPSGDLLREWLAVDFGQFYNPSYFGIVPMGFCYPGKGKSGDLAPRPECAPLWHPKLFKEMPRIELILLIGQYSQKYYLGEYFKKNLTETVRSFQDYLPKYFPLPHPSPRNRLWLKKNPWFEEECIPELRKVIKKIL